ncbi:HutD family protein [Microbacterium sp. B2969]|uniref:HutD family protein n=1 Tax=Microbacterium alkaliflavum TaxID=3248839 RepID=A0ABW7QBA9_9MICO
MPLDVLADLDVVTPADVSPQPWANGLGTTRVLVERLAWRVSIAEVRGRMPFSLLPGIDRILIPLTEPALTLMVDGVDHRVTSAAGLAFAGEAHAIAATGGRAVSVLNVMTRRALARTTWRIETHRGPFAVDPADTLTALVAGAARLDGIPLPLGSVLPTGSRPRALECADALIARFRVSPADAPQ